MKTYRVTLMVLLMIQCVISIAQEEEPEVLPYCIEVLAPDSATTTAEQDTINDVYLVFYENDLETIKELTIESVDNDELFVTTDLSSDKEKEKDKGKSKIKIKDDKLMIKVGKADEVWDFVILGKDKEEKDKAFRKYKSLEAFEESDQGENAQPITKFNIRMKR